MRMPVCCYPSVRSLTLGVSARRNECSSVGAQYILLPFHLGISALHRWKVNVWMNELQEMRMVSVLKANFVRKFACNMKVIFYFYSITKSGGDDRSTSNRKSERENISLSLYATLCRQDGTQRLGELGGETLFITICRLNCCPRSHLRRLQSLQIQFHKSGSTSSLPSCCCCWMLLCSLFFLFSPFVCGLFHFFLDVEVAIQ